MLAVRRDDRVGWQFVRNIDDPEGYVQACAARDIPIAEYRIIEKYHAFAKDKGVVEDAAGTSLTDALGWRYDRWYDCYRSPTEVIKKPEWTLSAEEFKRREDALEAVPIEYKKWTFKVWDEHGEVVEDKTLVSRPAEYWYDNIDLDEGWQKSLSYYKGKGSRNPLKDMISEHRHDPERYFAVQNLSRGKFRTAFTDTCFFGEQSIVWSKSVRTVYRKGETWVSEEQETKRHKPLVNIEADYDNMWDEYGASNDISWVFPNCSDMALLEYEIDYDWGRNHEVLEGLRGDMSWEEFHAHGVRLAIRLKALVQERVDIFYSKPFEDPDHVQDGLRIIVPRS